MADTARPQPTPGTRRTATSSPASPPTPSVADSPSPFVEAAAKPPPRVHAHPDDGTDQRPVREKVWPAKRYEAPDPQPMTGVRRAKALAGPGALITIVGLALLAIGITVVVPIVILVIGVGDLLVAAVLVLKDPYVRPDRREE